MESCRRLAGIAIVVFRPVGAMALTEPVFVAVAMLLGINIDTAGQRYCKLLAWKKLGLILKRDKSRIVPASRHVASYWFIGLSKS